VAVFDFVESDTVQIGSNEVNGANAIDGDTGARGISRFAAVQPTNSSATPEPGTVALVAAGLGLVLLRKRRPGKYGAAAKLEKPTHPNEICDSVVWWIEE
jgi:hypothetical protein